MQPPENSALSKGFVQDFCVSLATALSNACSTSWQVTLADQPSGAQPDASAFFRCSFEGTVTGELVLAFPAAALANLGLRSADTDDANPPADDKARLLSSLQEGLAGLAEAVDKSGSTTSRLEALENFVLADEQVFELVLQGESDTPEARQTVQLYLNQKLVSSVKVSSAKPFEFPAAVTADGANLDLVMDVELNVMLRFGQRQLALREVLELTSGSVVELDRQVDEPVELVLDGRVVARGEAVIIDGNYGMRITQLVQQPIL